MPRSIPIATCPHLGGDLVTTPRTEACEECGIKSPVRICVTCGHVGCCESHSAHNTKHAKAAGHPVIKSLPLDHRSFTWCYVCDAYLV